MTEQFIWIVLVFIFILIIRYMFVTWKVSIIAFFALVVGVLIILLSLVGSRAGTGRASIFGFVIVSFGLSSIISSRNRALKKDSPNLFLEDDSVE